VSQAGLGESLISRSILGSERRVAAHSPAADARNWTPHCLSANTAHANAQPDIPRPQETTNRAESGGSSSSAERGWRGLRSGSLVRYPLYTVHLIPLHPISIPAAVPPTCRRVKLLGPRGRHSNAPLEVCIAPELIVPCPRLPEPSALPLTITTGGTLRPCPLYYQTGVMRRFSGT
jgi:hypothetical protein